MVGGMDLTTFYGRTTELRDLFHVFVVLLFSEWSAIGTSVRGYVHFELRLWLVVRLLGQQEYHPSRDS